MAKKSTKTPSKKLTKTQMESSIPASLERLKAATGVTDWTYNKKTRGFESARFIPNPAAASLGIKGADKHGAKISRRQFDKNFGLLKKQGFESFEQKAKVRKQTGLTGFKSKGKFAAYPMRKFTSREAMLLWLEQYSGNKTFRLLLHGLEKGNRYSAGNQTAIWLHANQLAPSNARDFVDDYFSEDYEKNQTDIDAWVLVVYPANGQKPLDHTK
jgi:hypothetical protein